jgi:hypothetical protein
MAILYLGIFMSSGTPFPGFLTLGHDGLLDAIISDRHLVHLFVCQNLFALQPSAPPSRPAGNFLVLFLLHLFLHLLETCSALPEKAIRPPAPYLLPVLFWSWLQAVRQTAFQLY